MSNIKYRWSKLSNNILPIIKGQVIMSGLKLCMLYSDLVKSVGPWYLFTNFYYRCSELLDLGFQLTKSGISLVDVPSSYHSKLDHFLAKITESLDKLWEVVHVLNADAADCVGLFVQQQLLDNNVISEQQDLKYLILNSCHREGVKGWQRKWNSKHNKRYRGKERSPIFPFLLLILSIGISSSLCIAWFVSCIAAQRISKTQL